MYIWINHVNQQQLHWQEVQDQWFVLCAGGWKAMTLQAEIRWNAPRRVKTMKISIASEQIFKPLKWKMKCSWGGDHWRKARIQREWLEPTARVNTCRAKALAIITFIFDSPGSWLHSNSRELSKHAWCSTEEQLYTWRLHLLAQMLNWSYIWFLR